MLSIFFYLILLLLFVAIVWLFLYQRKQKTKHTANSRQEPVFNCSAVSEDSVQVEQQKSVCMQESEYASNIIVLQIKAFATKPYMGYELLQALQSVGLHFGEKNIFYRYEKEGKEGKILFSVAAATSDGAFTLDNMGAFKCLGLVVFMKLRPKQKLMQRFDLMLDVARQLAEELGGDICDDLYQPINAAVIKRLREKICTIETSNLYVADLLDHLD